MHIVQPLLKGINRWGPLIQATTCRRHFSQQPLRAVRVTRNFSAPNLHLPHTSNPWINMQVPATLWKTEQKLLQNTSWTLMLFVLAGNPHQPPSTAWGCSQLPAPSRRGKSRANPMFWPAVPRLLRRRALAVHRSRTSLEPPFWRNRAVLRPFGKGQNVDWKVSWFLGWLTHWLLDVFVWLID